MLCIFSLPDTEREKEEKKEKEKHKQQAAGKKIMGSSSSSLQTLQKIRQLGERPIGLDAHEYWKPIFTTPMTYHDLSLVATPSLLRYVRHFLPGNLAALTWKCTEQLAAYVECGGSGNPVAVRSALCVLAKIIPFVLEPPSSVALIDFSEEALRGWPAARSPAPFAENFCTHVFEEGLTCDVADDGSWGPSRPLPAIAVNMEAERCLPLGQQLANVLVRLCFIPGYTLRADQSQPNEGDLVSRCPDGRHFDTENLWWKGIGSNAVGVHTNFDGLWDKGSRGGGAATASNRVDILRVMLLLLSTQLYDKNALAPQLFKETLTDISKVPLFPQLVVSMLNVIASYNPQGKMPYTSYMVTEHESVVSYSIQILGIVLDTAVLFRPIEELPDRQEGEGISQTPRDEDVGDPSESLFHDEDSLDHAEPTSKQTAEIAAEEPTPTAAINIPSNDGASAPSTTPPAFSLRKALAARMQPLSFNSAWNLLLNLTFGEASYLLKGMAPLVRNITHAKVTYLPNSQRQFQEADELMVLLWKLLDRCPAFFEAFTRQPEVKQYLVPIVQYALEVLDAPLKFPQTQLVLFMLTKATSSRNFVIRCNEALTEFLPFTHFTFKGTFNDLIILTMHKLLVTAIESVDLLREYCANIIANIAPYVTSLCDVAAQRMVHLLEVYGTLAKLNENVEVNTLIVAVIVEAIANMLQYQFNHVPCLAFELVRSQESVQQFVQGALKRDLPFTDEQLKAMPLATLQCAVSVLVPMVRSEVRRSGHGRIIPFLSSMTLVGELPLPQPILMRSFQSRPFTDAWVCNVLWGSIFTHSLPGTLVDSRMIQLFNVGPPPTSS